MTITKLVWGSLKVILILVLPFVILVRGSVYLHSHHHFFPSLALIGGLALTFVILFLYLTFFYHRIMGKSNRPGSLKRRSLIVLLVLISYIGYGLLYLSAKNAKNSAIAKEFRTLHPVLRMGVSTILLLDRDLVITDADRRPEDYQKMGLRAQSQSLHYRQSSGYVHALDIRTSQRSGLRNFLLKYYFKAMGFNVLRHGGTADHLHISLLSHDRPYAY